mmetsp:Transcript_27233/g.37753  ORF Transcript_27233/g.37753 Transcript_27233/m.37753 type:complete len:93 (+) Transcript_27233:237-515(+)
MRGMADIRTRAQFWQSPCVCFYLHHQESFPSYIQSPPTPPLSLAPAAKNHVFKAKSSNFQSGSQFSVTPAEFGWRLWQCKRRTLVSGYTSTS